MIEPNVRFEGFDAASWGAVLGLFRPKSDREAGGTLLVVVDASGGVLAALHTHRGPVRGIGRADDLEALATHHGARRVLRIQHGTLEAVAERLARAYSDEDDYAAQLLEAARVARHFEQMGYLSRWPHPRVARPIPSRALLQHALDAVLPAHRALLVALYEAGSQRTAIVLARGARGIDRILGPLAIDDRSDTPPPGPSPAEAARLRSEVEARVEAVHLGIFGDHPTVASLLRDQRPGAWLRAAADRRILFDPAPPMVAAGLAVDGVRVAAHASAELLAGSALGTVLTALGRGLGHRLAGAPSMSDLLGWSPLEALADLLDHDLDLNIRHPSDPPTPS